MNPPMKVLVTGATGFLGRALVGALTAHGHTVIAFGRSATASGLSCAAADGDIRDEPAVLAAADGCDAICHAAAMVAVWSRRRADFDDINVGGLRTILRVTGRLSIKRVVYTSSFLALPPTGSDTPSAGNDYQRTKVLADRLAADAAAAGVPLVRVYPGVIYGPGPLTPGNLVGRSIADHLAGRLPGIVAADRIWSYAYLDDVAEGHVAALERGRVGERYLLCGENARQMRVFEIVRDLTGTPLPRRIPVAAAWAFAAVEQGRAALTGRAPQLTIGTVGVLNRDWSFPSELARRELGYRVRPLAEGLVRVVAAIRDMGTMTPGGQGQGGRVNR
jgi:NAD+-dependent farnesol dehydrogenase